MDLASLFYGDIVCLVTDECEYIGYYIDTFEDSQGERIMNIVNTFPPVLHSTYYNIYEKDVKSYKELKECF